MSWNEQQRRRELRELEERRVTQHRLEQQREREQLHQHELRRREHEELQREGARRRHEEAARQETARLEAQRDQEERFRLSEERTRRRHGGYDGERGYGYYGDTYDGSEGYGYPDDGYGGGYSGMGAWAYRQMREQRHAEQPELFRQEQHKQELFRQEQWEQQQLLEQEERLQRFLNAQSQEGGLSEEWERRATQLQREISQRQAQLDQDAALPGASSERSYDGYLLEAVPQFAAPPDPLGLPDPNQFTPVPLVVDIERAPQMLSTDRRSAPQDSQNTAENWNQEEQLRIQRAAAGLDVLDEEDRRQHDIGRRRSPDRRVSEAEAESRKAEQMAAEAESAQREEAARARREELEESVRQQRLAETFWGEAAQKIGQKKEAVRLAEQEAAARDLDRQEKEMWLKENALREEAEQIRANLQRQLADLENELRLLLNALELERPGSDMHGKLEQKVHEREEARGVLESELEQWSRPIPDRQSLELQLMGGQSQDDTRASAGTGAPDAD